MTWNALRDLQGSLWVAAGDLDRIDMATGKAAPQHSGKQLRTVFSITLDGRGHIWLGSTDGSLMDFDPVTDRMTTVSASLGHVYRVLFDRSDDDNARVWVCTSNGVWYASPDDWRTLHRVEDHNAPNDKVWSVIQDTKNNLWFTSRNGLYRLTRGVWSLIALPEAARVLNYPMLGVDPDGTLWMQAPMPTPVLHLKVTGQTAQIIGALSSDMVGSDDVHFIHFDSRGWLWIGTDLGVYVSDGKRWVQITQEDGLLSDDTDTKGIFQDMDGSMWISTASGVSHLINPATVFAVTAPRINVHEVRLNGEELQPNVDTDFDMRRPELSVELFSTFYARPRAVVFRYRLLGLQNSWQTSSAGKLIFSELPASEYVLSVQAYDQRIHSFSAPVNYPFIVLPPWYRRTPAKLGAASLLLLLGWSGWLLSVRRLKASETRLRRKVDHQTAQLRNEKEQLECAQRELLETARRDPLTGLLNRSAIFDVLAMMRDRVLDEHTTLSVVMADLDRFKSINDHYGHAMGDAVLRECAQRLRRILRPVDAVGRYGGEELLILIPGLEPSDSVSRLEEIRAAIANEPVIHGDHQVNVTCSFGVAWLDERCNSMEASVESADAALYLAKQNGRDRVEFAIAQEQPEEVLAGG